MGSTRLPLQDIADFVAGIIDGRDPDLSAHHDRLARRAHAFSAHLGCSSDETQTLAIGMSVHDIGKLSIGEYLLHKPARLTPAEFALIKQHTQFGHQLLRPLRLDRHITDVVLYHHENYDGSGYPEGRAGSNIPFMARVARILDSFDALTEDRPYHRGVGTAQALTVLRRDAHWYDPLLLDQFCDAMATALCA